MNQQYLFEIGPEGMFFVKTADRRVHAACVLPDDLDASAIHWYAGTHAAHAFLMEKVSSFFVEGRLLLDKDTSIEGLQKEAQEKAWRKHPRLLLMEDQRLLLTPDTVLQKQAFEESPFTKENELELWHRYKKDGDHGALNNLMRSFRPLVLSRTKPWTTNSPLPKAAVEGEGMRLLRQAIDTYSPDKGAALNTHIWNRLNKIHRYGYTYQNVGSIPEPRAAKVGQYQNTFEILKGKLNREPTLDELKQELGWKMSDLKAIQEELRADLQMDDSLSNFVSDRDDPTMEAMMLAYHEASPEKKLVMEYTFDEFKGKPSIDNVGKLAKQLNMTPSDVRKTRRDIAFDIRGILDQL